MEKKALYEQMEKAVIEGNPPLAREYAQKALDEGVEAKDAIVHGFSKGIEKVGKLWEEGDYFLPELVAGAEAMKAAMEVLQKNIQTGRQTFSEGKIVIGTVAGDIHDIGKTLVASIFSAHGFEVLDLGADVPPERFLEKAQEFEAQVIGLSALLTTTMVNAKKVIDLVNEKGLRDKVKIIVGGAPVTKEWALSIGADDAPPDAFEAVASVKKLLAGRVLL
ncbi:MAG: corrinoid protein [Candidatus Eremiobacteraeota bacterium]|nr:corrinoid protein [Candidatus Eremiobacteraeota bacterium]